MKKYVYTFINNSAEGSSKMKNLLGGKGANLAEMTNLGIPVPPGFTISTDVCSFFMKNNKYPPGLKAQVEQAIKKLELYMGKSFGNNQNPLLFSVRSGARQSMPGMMETVLNIGLNKQSVKGLGKTTNNQQFAYDSYRRLITMYADVVLDKTLNINQQKKIRRKLEKKIKDFKINNNYLSNDDISTKDFGIVCNTLKKIIYRSFKHKFPENPRQQLWESINAVLKSWNGKRAIDYRNIEKIPHTWGTAINIQCMVFGNMGNDSATGVAFTRNPATGERVFFGEWLKNAQGEDVVAGIRTPNYINNNSTQDLKTQMPNMFSQLNIIQKKLEKHYKEMQDIEFTIEKNKLWILQTRTGKRNGIATIKIALDMYKEKLFNKKIMLSKILPIHINEILHSTIDPKAIKKLRGCAKGLPAGPGAATGKIVFNSKDAERCCLRGEKVILVREETSPEDIHGMFSSKGILTTRGGMTSHAALVARGWGKCCIVGCNKITINESKEFFKIGNKKFNKNDWLTLDGTSGTIYAGQLSLIKPEIKKNKLFNRLLSLIKSSSKLKVRSNADRPEDAIKAKSLGAYGVGLCRTEHMFFNPKRIIAIRKMIVANSETKRRVALSKLLPLQEKDFYQILKAMNNMPVTIRLLDPPLHEFLPTNTGQINKLARELNMTIQSLNERIENLHETNPMLGHRGCRLGISFPEITEMQTTAIIRAIIKLKNQGFNPRAEIMIPLVGSINEFIHQKEVVKNTLQKTFNKTLSLKIGTMIELPRACLIADQIAKHADFLSFGTNDLTQTTFGFSRDDVGSFMPEYINNNILQQDPFHVLDQEGVGELIKIAILKAKSSNPKISIGICGEHGGNPQSIEFLYNAGIDYVSCSPYRIPIAYLTLAKLS